MQNQDPKRETKLKLQNKKKIGNTNMMIQNR